MRRKLVRCIRYALQVVSLAFFVLLFTKLRYPVEWQADALKWFSRLDPWGLFNIIRSQGKFPVWGWLPLLILIITLLFGRVFCGWICPLGALLMLTDKISRMIGKIRFIQKIKQRGTKAINRLHRGRYFWLLFLAITFLLGLSFAYSLTPFALFSHEIVRMLKGTMPWVLLVIIIMTLLFSRLWCSLLCPTGLLLSLIGYFRIFRYQVAGTCIHCSKCTKSCPVGASPADTGVAKEGCLACGECQMVCPVKTISFQPISFRKQEKEKKIGVRGNESDITQTRRQFLKTAGTGILAAAVALSVKPVKAAKKVLRPPGALPDSQFVSVCNRCGRCIKVCPNNALKPMSITDGIEYFDTPHIIPREGNCCLCLSCQEVCPTGAIMKTPLEQIHMGKAELNRERCLAWAKQKICLICVEQCPLGAITYDNQQRPIIQTGQCIGCGSCERACAVEGEAAIRVRPK